MASHSPTHSLNRFFVPATEKRCLGQGQGMRWGVFQGISPTLEAISNYDRHLSTGSGGRAWGLCGERAEPALCPKTCQ